MVCVQSSNCRKHNVQAEHIDFLAINCKPYWAVHTFAYRRVLIQLIKSDIWFVTLFETLGSLCFLRDATLAQTSVLIRKFAIRMSAGT